ncbi:MAG: GntR family transcriptional regulator [Rhodospirillales bacterium]|nr:GntR family transcriptional regulator [Rhodospirillales bacterium]
MDYRQLADQMARDIESGRLQPGEQLPPQRRYAWDRGIAVSTASRAYAELVRRGLAMGEVGRGTFVRAKMSPMSWPGMLADSPTLVDLERVWPILPAQSRMIADCLRSLLRDTSLDALQTLAIPEGDAAQRAIVARFLGRNTWLPQADAVVFAGSGRQAIGACLAAVAKPGDRVGFETLTYPMAKAMALQLGLVPVPIEMDEHGMSPAALEAAHATQKLAAIYVQPTLHNPTSRTMPAARRIEMAKLLETTGLIAIEDGVYSYLEAQAPPPLAAFAPNRVLFIESLSKRVAPGMSVGMMVLPPPLHDAVVMSLRARAVAPNGLALAAVCRLIADGLVDELAEQKRGDATARVRVATEMLSSLRVRAPTCGYHVWVDLDEPWRAETFVAACVRRGIALTAAAAFSVSRASPNAVRIALATPPLPTLRAALAAVAQIAASGPDAPATE